MLDQAARRRRMRTAEARSYSITVAILYVYALFASIIVMRTVLVAFGATESVWTGRFVYGLTSRATDVLEALPGANREIWGPFTMVDISLLGLVLLFPLGLVATSGTLNRRA
ncbi:MAG: hypothetical protein H0U38_06055 [Chloroflexia bacterium]|nr:hypothetical protein [Chloroflexia bacterium]MDQ3614079.1 hypothetical protein [Chloroflexota bacterium]